MAYRAIAAGFALAAVTGCATLDPLGSPQQQSRDPEKTYSADFPVQAGYICRELQGRADVEAFEGQGRGGRCQQIGEAPLAGCFRFSSDRVSFESSGCFEEPSPVAPQAIKQLEEQLDALETEFEHYLKGEK